MNKPKPKLYLDWTSLTWFIKDLKVPEWNERAVSKWLTDTDSMSNGVLVTASGECLDPEFKPWSERGYDWSAIRWFMQFLHDNFPDAVDEYGDVKIYYSW
ncbi:MAG: hypothetical protein JO112_20255 [Planctomycetes bacterium]|nr:hypothetical protein [Planctomycetota bacterium]